MTNPNAAALAALNQRILHTCPICGQGFTGIKIARYCSNRCRQAAKRQRAAGEKRGTPGGTGASGGGAVVSPSGPRQPC